MADCLDELSLVNRAVLAVSAQMPVRSVLQVIVDSARTVAGARYAALGVPDENGSFGEFVVSGLTPAEQRAIGPLPRQHGPGQARGAGQNSGRGAGGAPPSSRLTVLPAGSVGPGCSASAGSSGTRSAAAPARAGPARLA